MLSHSPLRYPGGKRRLAPVVLRLLQENELVDVAYAEPFAGGAAIGLSLLLEEAASIIHINDLSRPVHSFWHMALYDTEALCQRISRTKVTMTQWRRQRKIYEDREDAAVDDLGFATFFLNRTNRSGIIGGGVIGGKAQAGKWSLDVRFNKEPIIEKIRKLGRYRDRIKLYSMDALDFTKQVVAKLGRQSFTFYDPPYISLSRQLYLNNYKIADHRTLANRVCKLKSPWIVTYDRAVIEHALYEGVRRIIYKLHYTVQKKYCGEEVMFISNDLRLPPTAQLVEPTMEVVHRASHLLPRDRISSKSSTRRGGRDHRVRHRAAKPISK